MKFLLVIIIAAIAVCIAIGAYIKNDREWKQAWHKLTEDNNRLHRRIKELLANKDDLKEKNAELRADQDRLRRKNTELYGKCETLADENLRLEQKLREYGQHGTVIPVDDRKVYFERDGIRHIFVDNEYQGWYDPVHEVVEVDD